MGVQIGDHTPPPPHCSGLGMNKKNALMTGCSGIGAMGGFLGGIFHLGAPDDRIVSTRLWKRTAKRLEVDWRWSPLDLVIRRHG